MESADIHDVCDEGGHELVWKGLTQKCQKCGLSSQAIADWLGHEVAV